MPPRPVVVGLALSGGAAKGDFEIGVVEYLYNVRNVKPSVISGTSVGAINALKLAEGEPKQPSQKGPDGHRQGLAGLKDVWLDLRKNADMWTEAFKTDDLEAAVKEVVQDAAATAVTSMFLGPIGLLAWLFSDGDSAVEKAKAEFAKLTKTRSLYTLKPTRDKMSEPASLKTSLVTASGIKLRMAMVSLEDTKLRYVTETGALLERDGTPVTVDSYDPKQAKPILDEIKELESEIKAIQEEAFEPGSPSNKSSLKEVIGLRKKIASLRAKLNALPKTKIPVTTGLVNAAMASSSLPFVFEPVQVGGMWYIDGGIRSITPIEGAFQAGADFVYAVVAGSPATGKQYEILGDEKIESYAGANLLDIGMRASTEIMPSEIGESELFPPNGWGKPVVVIQPPDAVDVHDGLTIDPGLIRIRVAQGYMRADDVMQAWDVDKEKYIDIASDYSTDRNTVLIAQLRRRIWQLEFRANGFVYRESKGSPKDAHKPAQMKGSNAFGESNTALQKVRNLKRDLKALVDQRIAAGGKVPDGVEKWWLEYERHPWNTTRALWDAEHPFTPPKEMDVTVTPKHPVPNKPVDFTVYAKDKGQALDGNVFVDGKQIGKTGVKLHYTFVVKTQVTVDPETKEKVTEKIGPVMSVTVPGYQTEYPLAYGDNA